MNILILDPRPQSLAAMTEAIAAEKAAGRMIAGFEVSVPALAELCDLNIDPQHAGKNSKLSAIWAVATGVASVPVHKEGYCYCTPRADLDAFGAMVVSKWLFQCGEVTLDACADRISPQAIARIKSIHEADTYANAGVWEPRELFAGGYEISDLAAIARAVSDFKVDPHIRLEWMERWLETGEEPSGYRAQYEQERSTIAKALDSGETKVETVLVPNGLGGYSAIAVVRSTLRAATTIGYSKAPVVVALNPSFPDRTLGTVKKFTVCQYQAGYCDLPQVWKDLSDLEPGWGGSTTIGGSPQGQSSNLPLEKVVEVVRSRMNGVIC